MTLNWLDITTALLGLVYILLEWRASWWMWIVGIVMQVLGIVLYFQKGIYADSVMEFYYLAMSFYGLALWLRHKNKKKPPLPITHIPRRHIALWTLALAAMWAGIWAILHFFTDSNVPVLDSFTTALSVVGMWALARKYVEQWLIWIAVDSVTCYLYFIKDIPFKASLYALYIIIAIVGFITWNRRARISQVENEV